MKPKLGGKAAQSNSDDKLHNLIVNKTAKGQCRYCFKKLENTVITKHILQCSKVPAYVKTNTLRAAEICNSTSNVLKNNVPILKSSAKKELWELLARAIFISGTPFSIVENSYWKEFLTLLRPDFVLPSRKWLSTVLLDNEFNKVKTEVEQAVQSAKSFSIQTDSWSNIKQEPIVNIIATVPKPLLIKTIYTGTTRHTGEFYANEIKKAILLGGKERCMSVCTDNEATMAKARKLIIQDPEFSNLTIADVGCGVHYLNLLVEDIFKKPTPKQIKTKTMNVIVTINGSRVLKEQLKVFQKEVYSKYIPLARPVDSRWGYMIPCMQSVLKNRSTLVQLVNCEEVKDNLPQDLKSIILDDAFWIECEQLCFLLEPLKILIANFEADTSCLHNVYFSLKEIDEHLKAHLPLAPLSKKEEQEILNEHQKRSKMILKPIHFAGNILNPLCQGKTLSTENMNHGIEYIKKVSLNFPHLNSKTISTDLKNYLNHEGFWDNDFLWNTAEKITKTSRILWNSVCGSTSLSKVASAILAVPVTSSATERSFSIYGHIHTKKRNKLTAETAGKVVYISYNSRNLHCSMND